MNHLHFSTISGGLRGGCFSYGTALVNRQMRSDLFSSLVKQEIGFFDATNTGIQRMWKNLEIHQRIIKVTMVLRFYIQFNLLVIFLNFSGEIISRLTADCETMSSTVSTNVNVFLRNIVMLIGALVFMITLSWRLSLVNFIIIPVVGFVTNVYGAYYDVSLKFSMYFFI